MHSPGRPSLTRWSCATFALLLTVLGCSSPSVVDDGPRLVRVEVFFANDRLGDPCGEVFPVAREVGADDPVREALRELLRGPTDAERAEGYGGWFTADTADMLVEVRVVDRIAHVVFADLRSVIPDASSSCGSAGLLAQLDRTLLAFDGIDQARYALDGGASFDEWLQLAPPDLVGPPADLAAGWTLVAPFDWPVEPGCCGMDTVGPTSPAGAISDDGWPSDGFYEATAIRPAQSPGMLRLELRRWVSCSDAVGACTPESETEPSTGEDRRITGDPAGAVVRTIPIDDLGAVLIPAHDFGRGEQPALEGEPGAFARLLEQGVDGAYRTWIHEPFLAGSTVESIQRSLLEGSADPSFPFGRDYCGEHEDCGPLAYRGPFGVSLVVDPTWMDVSRWPPGSGGLYSWHVVTLEVREGQPILHVWAGQIAG